ncbi:MAG TPA: hypothetical protein VJX67_15890 [Blastocatellia bacterium]|nr:hypothetical protein [Blastocatellia bacterium]
MMDALYGETPARQTPAGYIAPVTRFVVLAAPRTGSNWLCSLLNSHPEILCHHEIFNPAGIHYALDHRDGNIDLGTIPERDRSPELLLARLWRVTFGKPAVGFKLNRGQNNAVFQGVIRDSGIRKIIMVRRNRIKTFVSEIIAERTGEWESYCSIANSRSSPAIEVKVTALLDHIALNARYYDGLRKDIESSGQTPVEIAYEDIGRHDALLPVFEALGVSPHPPVLKAGTRKQHSNDLRDLVSNFAELDALLKGSDLERELHALDL